VRRARLRFEFPPDASRASAGSKPGAKAAGWKATDPPTTTYPGANLVAGGAAFLPLAVLNTGIHNGLLTVRRASPITTLLRMSLVRDASKRDRQDTGRRKESNDIGADHLSLASLAQSAPHIASGRRPSPFSPIVWPLSVNRQGGVTRYRAERLRPFRARLRQRAPARSNVSLRAPQQHEHERHDQD
jgi:hypothetical protein